MAVRYRSIDGELVSQEWFVFLNAARRAGVHFEINEGHRTLARQQYFWNCYRCRCCNNGNLAAFPSPVAPHIRTGRIDHAIDSDELSALIAYGARNGVTIRRTVAGESWHGEASAAQLRAFARSHGEDDSPCRILSKGESKLVSKLFYHRKGMRHQERTGRGPMWQKHYRYARWYKRRLNLQAAYLYALGKSRGFGIHNRGKRRALIRRIVEDGKRRSC